MSDAYKKIRNTARFILGNISNGDGFNPDKDAVSDDELLEIDKWALMRLDSLIDRVQNGYNEFDFHIAFHSIHNFCVTDMSNFYLDIIKDRLYCEGEKSVKRRAAQTAMYRILSGVARLIAPIMSFTAEEIWSYLPHCNKDNAESIFLNEMPEKSGIEFSDEFIGKWEFIYNTRETVNKVLEEKRNEKVIGKSLEANVIIHCCGDMYEKYNAIADQLAEILIVSGVSVVKADNESPQFEVVKATGEKCERCWVYSETVGRCNEHPTLCDRCAGVVE